MLQALGSFYMVLNMKIGEVLERNIRDAHQEIGEIIERFQSESGEIDEIELKVDLAEALWHLCAAWNARHLSFDEVNRLGPEQFRSLGKPDSLKIWD